jgi:tRNA-specific 2-thiouridylase
MSANKTEHIRVAVGLSGGVDSSVAAALLAEEGFEVTGITMEVFDGSFRMNESARHTCFGPGEEEDIQAAASVCRKLKVPFHVIDLKKEYRSCVIDYFRREYLCGKTPNPCAVCNQRLKFGFMLNKAQEAGIDFDFFATGHYARIQKSGSRFLLKKARDLSKDQTYFLYGLTPAQLSRTLFPLGEYTKEQVRSMARSLGLATADRPESQDFMGGGGYAPLFKKEELKGGDIVDAEGKVLGKHRGIIHYTVGQRRGLGIASHRPLYVVRIDPENNRIVVGDKEALFSKGLIMTGLNLIAVERLDGATNVKVKIRLKHKEADAKVFPLENGRAKILFRAPQMSVTPGQCAVLYSGDTVIGGGVIESSL